MSKKILVLNGSPREKGNTVELIDEFVKGAEESGNEIVRFNLNSMNIHPCQGCLGGGKNTENPCVQRDDMDKIYPIYAAADIVVLASPMYYWSFSSQLKCAFDRLFAVAECNENHENPRKDCILLMSAEGSTKSNFAPVVDYYEALLNHMRWRDYGMMLAGGNMNIGDIKNKPEQLKEARKLGASIK
ncbi:flavodoxin family protein [Inconstantimicrobium mannanitabidum]|uniref:Flavodoxin family protein n=1 Tax=Inconstantimicrobium mannanitabidum TaxID=1604901 RepID=A0ACB5R7W6_9CLOT|nr:flavodoxin family protein [Clostridium sp. TW13]GKX65257.1 flavodoxin family protein [Clostridium sp. TW13]